MFPEDYRKQAESLPLTVAALDKFNRHIQVTIQIAEDCHFSATAIALAQIKLLANRRFDRMRRAMACE